MQNQKYTLWQCLWYGQRMLVYPAGFFNVAGYLTAPYMYGLPSSEVKLTTKDKVQLCCYLIKSDDQKEVERSRGTFIMCHGNGMTQSSLLPNASEVHQAGFNVLTLEYRGYPGCAGRPSEKGLQQDAQAALDFILADPILSTKPVIVFGQSLGGAVAIDLTSRNAPKISALIVENSFTSIPGLVSWRFPLLLKWLSLLCTQRWNSLRKIKKLPPSLPILMLSGLLDEVVPPFHMQRLWDASQTRHAKGGWWRSMQGLSEMSGKKMNEQPINRDEFFTFEYGDHVDTREELGYPEACHGFLNKIFPTHDSETTSTHRSEG